MADEVKVKTEQNKYKIQNLSYDPYSCKNLLHLILLLTCYRLLLIAHVLASLDPQLPFDSKP